MLITLIDKAFLPNFHLWDEVIETEVGLGAVGQDEGGGERPIILWGAIVIHDVLLPIV